MEDNSSSVETDVELEFYEKIVGNLNYTTPVTERSSRSISYSEDRKTRTTFKEHIITNTSESTVTSASAAIVGPVTWPDPRSSCSLAGNYQVPWPLAQRSDGMSFATYISCGPHAGNFRIVFPPRHKAQRIVLTECSFEFVRRCFNLKIFIIMLALALIAF